MDHARTCGTIRAFDFLPTHASVTRQKVPQARIGNSVEEIARIDIPLAVTFAREGEHSVRTCFNTAVDQAGEVHAEEGELRIGHGVDQVAHERLAVRNLSRTLRRQPAYFIELFPLNLVGQIQAWVAG